MRVVDYGHEEVGCGDDASSIVERPNGRVVCGFVADKKALEWSGGGLVGEERAKNIWIKLAAAAAAVGEFGQTNWFYVHDVVSRNPSRFKSRASYWKGAIDA
jgi:hypothetical protein